MLRTTAQVSAVFLALGLGWGQLWYAAAQTTTNKSPAAVTRKKRAGKKPAKGMALAMSAGPAAISRKATIIACGNRSCADMNQLAQGPKKQLRAGTNGWVCYALKDGPMCLDKQWQKWIEAWTTHSDPRIEGTGIGYMLQGDTGSSNTDPFAMAPTANNMWVVAPPHIMVLYQDPKMLDAYPTDPKSGGPWVMWKGTPYAHLMVPVSRRRAAS